jgi:hypothetical protein
MFYVVQVKGQDTLYVTEATTKTDAVLTAYREWAGHIDYEDAYHEAGDGNTLAEQVLADVFDCTETYRAMVLQYVEQRLDGDRFINILL